MNKWQLEEIKEIMTRQLYAEVERRGRDETLTDGILKVEVALLVEQASLVELLKLPQDSEVISLVESTRATIKQLQLLSSAERIPQLAGLIEFLK